MSATTVRVTFFLYLLLLALCSGACAPPQDTAGVSPVDALSSRDSITVVITDSGLGGLAIVADAVEKLRERPAYAHARLIFYNALFTNEGGYNSLPGRKHKVNMFDRALHDIQERCTPDVIFIACNTLSVLYSDTEFAATTRTPVVGIISDGVDLIASRMPPDGTGRVIIFATETTIDEDTHRAALIKRGVAPAGIVPQRCPELALYIERGFDSMDTQFLIDAYVGDALSAAGDFDGPLYVSFNCTHYGYALDAWRSAFETRGVEVAEFLNPNSTMIDVLLPETVRDRHDRVTVSVEVVSMVEIPPDRHESIGRYLQNISPETAAALRDYEWKPDLFQWRDLLENARAH